MLIVSLLSVMGEEGAGSVGIGDGTVAVTKKGRRNILGLIALGYFRRSRSSTSWAKDARFTKVSLDSCYAWAFLVDFRSNSSRQGASVKKKRGAHLDCSHQNMGETNFVSGEVIYVDDEVCTSFQNEIS